MALLLVKTGSNKNLLFIVMIADLSVPGYSNLFTGFVLNALDMYMNYTVEVTHLHSYIVWLTSVQM